MDAPARQLDRRVRISSVSHANQFFMKIKSQRDFFAGLMFATVGAAFAIGATQYNVGSGARMGPGYFPLMLGILLAALGLVVVFGSLSAERAERSDGDPVGQIAWRPLVYIIGANLLFGVMLGGVRSLDLPAMGLVVGIYALVLVACRARPNFPLRSTLVLATVLALGSYLIFILGLRLQFPTWPTFISG
jgi:hypothetical protein